MPNYTDYADYDALMSEGDLFAPETPRPTAKTYLRRSSSVYTPVRSASTPYQSRSVTTTALKDNVISVTAAIMRMQGVLGDMFAGLWIAGEVSELKLSASGHVYFTIKEGESQISCVYFRGQAMRHPVTFRIGDKVEISATPDIYGKSGRLQLRVGDWRHAGMGELYEAYLRLKKKLATEGLFSAERKRPLPFFIRRAAVVTSAQAAALQDVIRTVRRRTPWIKLTLIPAMVQGDRAPETLIRALRKADTLDVDAVLLVRGGGSFEDLNGFNDEALVRCVASMRKPVIAGIGHETDETLATLAADCGTSTPTAAAEHLGKDKEVWIADLDAAEDELYESIDRYLLNREQALDETYSSLEDWMRVTFERKGTMMKGQTSRLNSLLESIFRVREAKVEFCEKTLSAPLLLGQRDKDLSRLADTLRRGMSVRLRREEERLFSCARTIRTPDDVLRSHTERMARVAQSLRLRVDSVVTDAESDCNRALARFSPVVRREVARKEHELLRTVAHLPEPQRLLLQYERRLGQIGKTLAVLDPRRPLQCGYALVTKNGVAVMRAAEIKKGDRVTLTFSDDSIDAITE